MNATRVISYMSPMGCGGGTEHKDFPSAMEYIFKMVRKGWYIFRVADLSTNIGYDVLVKPDKTDIKIRFREISEEMIEGEWRKL